jgi:hypothetical protein
MDTAKDELAKRPAALSKERLQVSRSEPTYHSGETVIAFYIANSCICFTEYMTEFSIHFCISIDVIYWFVQE